jgi:hypothetical protein
MFNERLTTECFLGRGCLPETEMRCISVPERGSSQPPIIMQCDRGRSAWRYLTEAEYVAQVLIAEHKYSAEQVEQLEGD